MDLEALVAAQRRAVAERPLHYADRLDALRRLERALLARADDAIAAISSDFGGRAADETRLLEILPVRNEIRYARRHLKSWMAPRRVPAQWQGWPATAQVTYHPRGVVGILSPWNYPLCLALIPLVGAMAAGNRVLLKPSETAPATAALLQAMLAELFPADYVSVVTGGAAVGAAVAALPLDHLLFTGSARVGRLVMKAASEHLVPVTLELGGKSPALVHPSYPVRTAAERILTGKLYNAGQTCIAPDYVLVPRARRAEFIHHAGQAVTRLYPSLAGNPDYTRIIHAAHYERLTALVEDARAHGAEVTSINPAGEPCNASNRVFPPTIVTGIHDEMAIAREEIFGPVLPVIEYQHIDDAIGYVNARPHPLAFYYFDERSARAAGIVERVVAGGGTVNDCIFHVGQPALPFGGIGPSGMGRYHGFDGFEAFSHKKGVMWQGRLSSLALVRPPYTPAVRRILRLLLRL